MNKEELDELKRVNKIVKPEGWDYYLEQGCEGHGVIITYTQDIAGYRSIGDSVFKRLVTTEEKKFYIATFNPEVTRKLLEYIEKLEIQAGVSK